MHFFLDMATEKTAKTKKNNFTKCESDTEVGEAEEEETYLYGALSSSIANKIKRVEKEKIDSHFWALDTGKNK